VFSVISWFRNPISALGLPVALLAACGGSGPNEGVERDGHSFARPDEARVTHVALDLTADFEGHRLGGTATLSLDVATGARAVVLDSRGLEVENVTDAAGGALEFAFGPVDTILGQALTVSIPEGTDTIVVRYGTSPDAAALQWLAPAQTADGRLPFLYSQGQAILTRTWIPTQDSPGIRQTYEARIVVPEGLRAVMSAEMLTPDGAPAEGGRAFTFRMPQAIPPYLIALAVGELAFAGTGPRTGVWAEPSVVARAAAEFADLEPMVAAAEALYGPYGWGRFDVLVLPPAFPFGGMENPRLTFATPTILAGDRSLVSLIAHELAHSWAGNLVTNATWRDFWLNEGVTSYIELRLMEALYGPERAAMLEVLARRGLADELAGFGDDSAETHLHLDLAGRNPDDGMTAVAYDKGAAFVRTIETAVGRPRFDSWLRAYFTRHAYTSITTDDFVDDLRTHLIAGDAELEQRLEIDRWVYGPGLPDGAFVPRSRAFELVDEQVRRWVEGATAGSLPVAGWSTQEWQHFLGALPDGLTTSQLEDLDRTYGLSGSGNSEVLFSWLMIAVRHHYEPALPALERFLTTQGRRKFLSPLYQALMTQASWGPALARDLYGRARPTYHAVAARTLDGIVR
jgi:aminopeptidase N